MPNKNQDAQAEQEIIASLHVIDKYKTVKLERV